MDIKSMIEIFKERYQQAPTHFSRAPGRVNVSLLNNQLIGEHIDYMGYGVLPFALEQECLILFVICGEEIQVQHVDSNQFPPQTIHRETNQFVNNYVKYFYAGYRAAYHFNKVHIGIKALINGNVPFSAGLSSSSSLVVASAFACLQKNIDKHQFVDMIIKCERDAGTACGGMDQTISAFGKEGTALFIEFDPIRLTDVLLPKGYAFIIANSLTESTKLETLGKHYNKRVSECRVGIAMLERKLNLNKQFKTLRQLQEHLQISMDCLEELIELFIPKGEIELEQLQYLGLKDLLQDIHSYEIVLACNKTFNPYNRIKHVLQEAQRVLKFKDVCASYLCDEIKVKLLGKLMNESQESCRTLYDCSSERIDILTEIAVKNGALGSRLTGAGWGGCTVSLIKEEMAEMLIEQISQQFYDGKIDKNIIFQTKPYACAEVRQIEIQV